VHAFYARRAAAQGAPGAKTRRRNADGSVVEYHQLAENVWDAAKGCAGAGVHVTGIRQLEGERRLLSWQGAASATSPGAEP
jgi:hypothetical protein